jgi:hypothetical protein
MRASRWAVVSGESAAERLRHENKVATKTLAVKMVVRMVSLQVEAVVVRSAAYLR